MIYFRRFLNYPTVMWMKDFLFSLLAKVGSPCLRGLARALQPVSVSLADWLLNPAVQYVLAALVALAALVPATVWAEATMQAIQPPSETRQPVDLERELNAQWQAGGEIVLFAGEDGTPRVGRRATPPTDAVEEQARRAEHFALARKLNLVTAYRVVPMALPLVAEQIELLHRFAVSDAGAVWFREMADDTLRLFNQGYLDYDAAIWQTHLAGGPRPSLSTLITGRLSEAGLFAQDASVFRIYAYDGTGSMAAAASVRMGRKGFRCQFLMSGESVDPFAILSHEFGHSRYGDPRSAGLPLGDTASIAPRMVMHNLIGPQALDMARHLSDPKAHLHLYGKAEARAGRKMGHVTIVG